MVVALCADQNKNGSDDGYSYRTDYFSPIFIDEMLQSQIDDENQYADGATRPAHKTFEPFDIHLFLLFGRHRVVSGYELGKFPNENSEQDKES